jgi:hypothetical protein
MRQSPTKCVTLSACLLIGLGEAPSDFLGWGQQLWSGRVTAGLQQEQDFVEGCKGLEVEVL